MIGPRRACSPLDRVFRILGGALTYVLTDNEKTVTTGHVAGFRVRNRDAVSFGRFYGVSVLTCELADPATKGGVENAVKLAKADIVPTDTNLLDAYESFTQVQAACEQFMAQITRSGAPGNRAASGGDARRGTTAVASDPRHATRRGWE